MKHSCITSLVWLLTSLLVPGIRAEQAGRTESDSFFGLTNLWNIHLIVTETDWKALESVNPSKPGRPDRKYPWVTCTFSCAGQTLSNVALRCKGNSSFNSSRGRLKHPFKLAFQRGHPGRTFLGAKEVSLNNNFNDATQYREALAYDTCRMMNLPTPRTAFARVSLTVPGSRTNQLLGLYTVAEPVDAQFLKSHFGTRKGLLLKPERLRSLEYLGEDWNLYTSRYGPKTEVDAVETRRFIALTRLIAQADDATFERKLPQRLDVDNFLRYLAVTAVLANYDSFVGNGHNYYLFQPASGGKATFIPWDLNEAFGGHPMAGSRRDQAELSVLHPQAGPNRLIDRVLANPKWRVAYRDVLASVLATACAPKRLQAAALQLGRLVQPVVFEESELARVSFQRIALGQMGLRPPQARFGPPGGPEDMPLSQWISLRLDNVVAELAGNREAKLPRMQNLPGRGGGPGPGRPWLWERPPDRPLLDRPPQR